jgi:hypothetical protein
VRNFEGLNGLKASIVQVGGEFKQLQTFKSLPFGYIHARSLNIRSRKEKMATCSDIEEACGRGVEGPKS